MKIKNLTSSIKKLATLTLSAFMLFVFLGVMPAQAQDEPGACTVESPVCPSGFKCDFEENVCVEVTLSEGGGGLSIPTGKVQISEDIVQTRTFGDLIITIVNYFTGFLGFLAVIVFIYAGVLMVLAGGSEQQVEKSRKMMLYAAIGLVVVILSYTIVTFITSSAGGENVQCTAANGKADPVCEDTEICWNGICQNEQTYRQAFRCASDLDCNTDEACIDQRCQIPPQQGLPCDQLSDSCPSRYECLPTEEDPTQYECQYQYGSREEKLYCNEPDECEQGWYCSFDGTCKEGTDLTCDSNNDCTAPKTCDPYGFCRNMSAGSGSTCSDNTDCFTGYVCNKDVKKCEFQGSGNAGGITGGPTQAATKENLDKMDKDLSELSANLADIADELDKLDEATQKEVQTALGEGFLADKIARVQGMLDATDDPETIRVLEKILDSLERLKDLREQLDELRSTMPESEDTIKAYDETSEALDNLIDDPLSSVKLRRFERDYRELQNLIRKFPIVQARIRAVPGEGNVPFTVTLDALDSLDPTGGTISDFKWSFLDNQGNNVSLGNDPVIVHEFTEPNTYSVRLQVGTSQTDKSGYKTAMDGVSYVRIRANPPASQVNFHINGKEVTDVFHATLDEAKAGLSFDPSSTVPAIGRVIEKYEWLYGDTQTEERTTPTTVIHTYQKPGEYFITLKVTDNHGVTDRKVVKLFVKSLAADIEVTPKEGNVNTEFHFRGIESRSDDGVIREYKWTVRDEEGRIVAESEDENFYYNFSRPGQYQIILLVTDSTGAQDKHLKLLKITSRKPVSSFTYRIPEPNHPNRVEFSALNSYDPDEGDKVTYSWDFDGDGGFEIVDGTDIQVTHEYKKTGQYRVILQVEDAFGERSQAEKGIEINSTLSGDIVLDTRSAQVGEEMTFKSDSLNAVAYLWEFGDGQTASTEEDTVKYAYNQKGKYKVKLNFFDEKDNDNSDSAYVLIGDRDEPVAAADVLINARDQRVTDDLCGEGKHGMVITRADNLTFSAKNSINRDGSGRLLSYDWSFTDGTRSSRKEFTHRFDEINREGECFEVGLVVRDQISGKLSAEDTLYFKVINETPTITDFVIDAPDQEELVTPAKVNLRVINPKDVDGQIKKYRWWYTLEGREDEKLGVHSTSTPNTEMVITAAGQPDLVNRYLFTVEITDNDNGVYSSTERFGELSYLDVKNGPNLSPVAEFTMDKTTIAVGDSITFISRSYDPQGDELPNDAYSWDFDGDGAFDDMSSGPQVNRQFNTPGEYTVRLKVVHRGLSSSATQTVFVEATNTLPQAAFTYQIDGNTVTFNAGNSRFDPDLPDTTLRYEWDFNVQEDANGNGINDDDVESTEMRPTITYPNSGTYRVRLNVKDALGMEGVVVRDVNLSLSQAEREKNTYTSLRVSSPDQPLTTLDVSVSPNRVEKGGTADVDVTIINADNSSYNGQVFFEVAEGSGDFTPNPVNASESKAAAIFTAVDPGTVRIRVRATGTYYGEIVEEAVLTVR